MNEMQKFRARCRQAQMIAFFMIQSTVVIAGLVFWSRSGLDPRYQDPGDVLPLRAVFYGVMAVEPLFILFMRRTMFRALPLGDTGNSLETRWAGCSRQLANFSIVSMAICQAMVILALVFFMLTGLRDDLAVMLTVSAVAFIVFFPRAAFWEEQARGQRLL